MGLINDGVNSLTRYVKNNYLDGARQDAFDLFLGVYKVDPSAPSPFVTEAVSVKVYLYPLALIVCLIMALLSVLRFKLVSALVYFVLTYVITQMILQSGQEFVGRPKLSGAALNKRVRRSVAADQPPSIKKDD
ncbi:hypothetical protein HK098_006240 [Nowakowskiella sp. JEL0407]|nr:hypothetical protein HK098_006240 [Nowakowskiella sp. JEL0407]